MGFPKIIIYNNGVSIMSDTIVSNAYNFSEFVDSGVDPRTGTYSITLSLGEFIGNRGNGIVMPISLNYNASNTVDIGFGRGWSIPITQFDKTRNVLSLSSGQSFELAWNSSKQEYDIPYRKLKDIRVFYVDATKELKVIYKDGREEYLGWDDGLLRRIVSLQGENVYFEYGRFNFRNVLWRIYDEDRRELKIDCWTNKWKTEVIHKQGEVTTLKFVFNKTGNGADKRLTSFRCSDELPSTKIVYRYIRKCYYDVVESITHASGLEEKITYLDEGHTLPAGAPLSKVPIVTRHVVTPEKNQPPQITTYTYSDKNYLGFASDRAWKPGEDSLFKANKDYKYTSTELINDSVEVTRTYNKYHLMDLAVHSRDGFVFKQEKFTYFADLTQSIELQPAIYSLVKQESVTYFNEGGASRVCSKHYRYDDYANVLRVTEADGTVTRYVYYPAKGAKGCPADPNGFVSQVKEVTVIPPDKASKPRKESFTYTNLPRLDDKSRKFILLLSHASVQGAIKYTYYSERDKRQTYGHRKTETKVFGGKKTQLSFVYTYKSDRLIVETTVATYDGLKQRISESTDYAHGNRIEFISPLNVKTVFAYDKLGRVIKETVAPDTPFEASIQFNYQLGDGINCCTKTDSKGNKKTVYYNNSGHPVREELNGVTVKEMHYDAFGLMVKETDIDTLSDSSEISVTTEYSYDLYGQVSKVVHQDGRVEKITEDVTLLTNTSEMVGLITETTIFDISGRPISKETKDALGTLLAKSSYTYDGFGNLLSVTDTQGRVSRFAYDNLDRIISTTRNIDNYEIKESYTYSSFSDTDEPQTIMVDSTLIGTRDIDGLGRKKSEEISGGKRSWEYRNGSNLPKTESTPQGNTLHMSYNDATGALISAVVDEDVRSASTFDYDAQSALLESTFNAYSKQAMERDDFGRVTKEIIVLNDGQEYSASYTYSLQGKVESQTDFLGNKTSYSYDKNSRPNKVTQQLDDRIMSTDVTYDQYSRPYHYLTTIDAKKTIEVELSFNSLGLETRRDFKSSDFSESIRQEFNSDQLLSKRISEDTQKQIMVESYSYDDLGRLTRYFCTGDYAPEDEHGNAIKVQEFNYDKYGNIVSVISTFSDNSVNQTHFTYSEKVPDRLIRMTNSHSSYPSNVKFNYDSAGHLLNDEQGLTYEYNLLGQMATVKRNGLTLSSYSYDSLGKVVSQTIDDLRTYFLYQNDRLCHEVCDGAHSTLARGEAVTSRTVKSGAGVQHQLLLANARGSIVKEINEDSSGNETIKDRRYTAYGEG